MKRFLATTLFALICGAPLAARAQEAGVGAPCGRSEVPAQAREACYTIAQAVESAQPQLGILVAGGNPTLGAASSGGLRLGTLPGVSATARANFVFVHVPDILAEEGGETVQRLNESVGLAVPALAVTGAVGVFPGLDLAPTLGGIGSVDLLGSATWLPLTALGAEGFHDEISGLTYGVGARLGILRESFAVPGVSVSLMYRSLGEVEYGNVCSDPLPLTGGPDTSEGYALSAGVCGENEGDPGEFFFDLTNWSARGVIGKRFLGLGLTGGVGYDTYESDLGFGFRTGCPIALQNCFVRATGLDLDSDRWSAFGNLSFTALVATFALEAGWMEGGEPIQGFDAAASDFDPTRGTLFGSVGVRLSF